jgi:Tfp pilus assembly protein PilN
LNGEISDIEERLDELKEKLRVHSVSVEQISHFKGSINGVDINGLASSIGACYTGLGIGTYRINLLPHKMEYEIKKVAPLATKVFLFLIFLMIAGIFAVDAVKQKNLLEELEEAIRKNDPEVKVIEKLTNEIKLIKTRSDFLYNIKEGEYTLEMLAELTKILPREAWISNLDYKGTDVKNEKQSGGELIISGFAASSSILIPILEDSPFFEKVEFVGTIKKTKDKEKFKLSARVVKPVKKGEKMSSGEVKK